MRFDVGVGGNEAEVDLRWSLSNLQVADAGGNWSEVDLAAAGDWQLIDARSPDLGPATRPLDDPHGIAASRTTGSFGRGTPRAADFGVIPNRQPGPVPAAVTAGVLSALRIGVGDTVDLTMAGAAVTLRVVAEVVAVPGTRQAPAAMIADLPSLAAALGRARPVGLTIAENWVATAPGSAASVAEQTRLLPGIRTLDEATVAATAGREPYGVGGRSALFAAGLGALLLALIGIGVDVRATMRRRVGEFAVLQTMGAGSRLAGSGGPCRAGLPRWARGAGRACGGRGRGGHHGAAGHPHPVGRPAGAPAVTSVAMATGARHRGRPARRGDAAQRCRRRHPRPPTRGGPVADRRRPVITAGLRRLRTFAGSLGLLALLALAASLLLTATPHLANRYTDQGLRDWISSLSHRVRDVSYLTETDISADPTRPTLRPSQANNLLGGLHFDLPPALRDRLSGEWYSTQITEAFATGEDLPAGFPPPQLSVRDQSGAESAARMVAGDWPATEQVVEAPVQTAVSSAVADTFNLHVGSRLVLRSPDYGPSAVLPVIVVGIFEPLDTNDPVWAEQDEVLKPYAPVGTDPPEPWRGDHAHRHAGA